MSSQTSSSPRNSFMGSVRAHAKEHHQSVQNAYEALYGLPARSQRGSVVSAPRYSTESNNEEPLYEVRARRSSSSSRRRLSAAWTSVKDAAIQHHRAMNAAYTTFYGLGSYEAAAKADARK